MLAEQNKVKREFIKSTDKKTHYKMFYPHNSQIWNARSEKESIIGFYYVQLGPTKRAEKPFYEAKQGYLELT